jgi:cbb3-type cytochrome oxidase subunit 3
MDLAVIDAMSMIAVIVAFIAVVGWAYGAKRREAFDEASLLALGEDNSEQSRG